MSGVTRYVSETVAGSLMNASLGAVSGVVVEVAQASAPAPDTLVHPAGSAGAATPSKFSTRNVLGTPVGKVHEGLPRSAAPSWTCIVAVSEAPHARAPTVNVKFRQTAGPPTAITP